MNVVEIDFSEPKTKEEAFAYKLAVIIFLLAGILIVLLYFLYKNL